MTVIPLRASVIFLDQSPSRGQSARNSNSALSKTLWGAKTVDSFFQPGRFPVSPESPCQRTLCNRLSFDPIASAIIAVTKLLILTPSLAACLVNFE